MKQLKLEISSIRKFGNLEIISFNNINFSIQPGQFIIVYHPEKDDHLIPIYFVLQLDDTFFVKPVNTNWVIGDQLIAIGPIGSGFSETYNYQNLLCISLGKSEGVLNPIIESSVRQGKNIAYMVEDINLILPNSVEIVFPNTLDENLLWADRVLIEGERDHLEKNHNTLDKILSSKIPAEILLYCPMLCSGASQCSVCSVKTKKGWIQTCQHGSVFNLNELEFS